MTATNVDIEQFITVLSEIHSNGSNLMNLEMIKDPEHPSMNKLIIHPLEGNGELSEQYRNPKRFIVRNPNIDSAGDDIFKLFNGLV